MTELVGVNVTPLLISNVGLLEAPLVINFFRFVLFLVRHPGVEFGISILSHFFDGKRYGGTCDFR